MTLISIYVIWEIGPYCTLNDNAGSDFDIHDIDLYLCDTYP